MALVFDNEPQTGAPGLPPKVKLTNLSSTAGGSRTDEPEMPGSLIEDEQPNVVPPSLVPDSDALQPLQPEHIRQLMQEVPGFKPMNDQIIALSDADQARPIGEKLKAAGTAAIKPLTEGVSGAYGALTKELPEALGRGDYGRAAASVPEAAVRAAVGLTKFGKSVLWDVPYEKYQRFQDTGKLLSHPLDYLSRIVVPDIVRNNIGTESPQDVQERHAAALEAANPTSIWNQNAPVSETGISAYTPDWVRRAALELPPDSQTNVEPLPQTSEALSNVLQLAAPLPIPQVGPVSTVAERAMAGAGKSMGEAAAQKASKGLELAGRGATILGELPEKVASAVTEKVVGEEAAKKVEQGMKAAESFGLGAELVGAHSGLGAVGAGAKAVKTAGEAAENVGKTASALAEGTSPLGRVANVLKSEDAPIWMKELLRASQRVGIPQTIDTAARAVKGAAKGAAIGAGIGALSSDQTPEEFGGNVGTGALFGGVHGAANKTAAMMERNYDQAAQLFRDQLAQGVPLDVLKKVPDNVFLNAVTFKKNVAPDVKIKFVDKNTAKAEGISPDVGGLWQRDSRTLYINPEARNAESTSWHEMMHPLMEGEVANRPEIKNQVDNALSQHGQSINDFKRAYAEAILKPQLEAEADPTTRETMINDWIKNADATSAAQTFAAGDPNFWAYNEFMAEAGKTAFQGKNLATDVLAPTMVTSLKNVLGKMGIAFKPSATSGKLFADFSNAMANPTLRKTAYNLMQQQAKFIPGITKPTEQKIKVTPEMYGNQPEQPGAHPSAVLHEQPDGTIGNDFVKVVKGQAVPIAKPEYMRREKNRRKEFEKAFNRDQPPIRFDDKSTDAVVPRTQPSGQVAMSGTELYPQIKDFATLNKYQKGVIQHLDQANKTGEPQTFWYHSIHNAGESQKEAPLTRYPGNVEAQQITGIGLGYSESKAHNITWNAYSQDALERKIQIWKEREGDLSLKLWHGDVGEFRKDLATWKANREAGVSPKTTIGADKANVINAMIVGGNRTFGDYNPLRPQLRGEDRQGIVRSFRVDRIESMQPGEGPNLTGQPKYSTELQNFSPGEALDTSEEGRFATPRPVLFRNAEGKTFKGEHVGNMNMSLIGKGMVPMVHPIEEAPGLHVGSTITPASAEKAGYSLEYAPNGQYSPGEAREPNKEVRGVAESYMKKAGLTEEPHTAYAPLDENFSKQVADWYDKAQHSPDNKAVKTAYGAFAKETLAQWKHITDSGVKMEPWTKEGQPYKNSAEMAADVRDNKHLWFFPTDAGFGGGETTTHPLLQPSGVEVNGKPLVFNDLFRAVHDYFGHAKEGYQFGPRGELNAYLTHSRMFSEEARPAMAAETMGQNSWVNFGPHLRDAQGNVAKKGEPGYVTPEARPFAEQKATLYPFRQGGDLEAKRGLLDRAKEAGHALVSTAADVGDALSEAMTSFSPAEREEIEQALASKPESVREKIIEHLNAALSTASDAGEALVDAMTSFSPGEKSPEEGDFAGPPGGAAPGETPKKSVAGFIGGIKGLKVKTFPSADLSSDTHEKLGIAPKQLALYGDSDEKPITWRYRPDKKALYWWETPSDDQREEVKGWLSKKGYEVQSQSKIQPFITSTSYRESHGRDSFSPGEAPEIEPKAADKLGKKILDGLNSQGGLTFNVATGKVQNTGYAASIYPDRSVKLGKPVDAADISRFIRDNYDLLSDKGVSLGLWDDKDANKVWLDVVMTTPDAELAKYAGQKYNQKAIGDLGKYAKGQDGDVPTGGTGEALEHMAPEADRQKLLREEWEQTHPKSGQQGMFNEQQLDPAVARNVRDLGMAVPSGEITPTETAAAKLAKKEIRQRIQLLPSIPDKVRLRRAMQQGFKEVSESLDTEAIDRLDSGKSWYKEDIEKMENLTKQIFPETEDPDKMNMFKVLLAAFNGGEKPNMNYQLASEAFAQYLKTGKVPSSTPFRLHEGGEEKMLGRQATMTAAKLNGLMETLGGEKPFIKYLLEKHPETLVAQAKDNYGAMDLGPKFGPFFLNMTGHGAEFTMDLWATRTWNRWMGTPFRRVGGESQLADVPSDEERALAKEAFKGIADKINAETGANLDTMDVQAILWFYEKDLYAKEGVTTDRGSFSKAAEKYGANPLHKQAPVKAGAKPTKQQSLL